MLLHVNLDSPCESREPAIPVNSNLARSRLFMTNFPITQSKRLGNWHFMGEFSRDISLRLVSGAYCNSLQSAVCKQYIYLIFVFNDYTYPDGIHIFNADLCNLWMCMCVLYSRKLTHPAILSLHPRTSLTYILYLRLWHGLISSVVTTIVIPLDGRLILDSWK